MESIFIGILPVWLANGSQLEGTVGLQRELAMRFA
jgi:hypothetical protein